MLLFPPAAFSRRGSFCDPCHTTSASTWAPVMKKMWKEKQKVRASHSAAVVAPRTVKTLCWRHLTDNCPPSSFSSSRLLIFISLIFLGHRLLMSHTVAVSQALTIVAAARKEEVWQPLISHPFLERHPVMRRFFCQRLWLSHVFCVLRIWQDQAVARSELSCGA